MQIQSLSVCVPAGCPNNCAFCVSKMKKDNYFNQIEKNVRFRDLYKRDYKRRLSFARDNGCNTVILTGNGEPSYNRRFLEDFFEWNDSLPNPFKWIELQTCGVGLDDEKLRWLRNAGVSTISLSMSSFDNAKNAEYNGTPKGKEVDIAYLCREIRRYDFSLRLSLNMTDAFDCYETGKDIFDKIEELGANQVTFRILYTKEKGFPQDKWIEAHKASDQVHGNILHYIHENGRKLERLPFGAYRYSVDGVSTVIDDDCMATSEEKETIRYLVLRPDCKLYTKWDDEGSLIF